MTAAAQKPARDLTTSSGETLPLSVSLEKFVGLITLVITASRKPLKQF
jgi:hypothetical protein